jgi:hypothetical protein
MSEVSENLKNTVVNDFEYFKNWYDFNFNVEKLLPEEALAKVFDIYRRDVFDILTHSDSTKTAIRKDALGLLGLKTTVDYDITARPVKLAITKKCLLERGMVIAGAIFYNRDIVKVISKKELHSLTEVIGEDIHLFIVKRGMMLRKMVPPLNFEAAGPIAKKIVLAGKDIFCKALFGLPNEIKKRLELIFGESFAIPNECEETLVKKCFDLVNFSIEKAASKANGNN